MIPLPIARPPWPYIGKKLESCVRKALFEFDLVEGVDRLAIALSGGKDSLSLLFLLNAIRGRGIRPFELVAITVSGEFTCGAGVGSSLVESVCKELDIPLIVRQSTKTLDTLECYSCSRERRSMLFSAAKEAGCQAIAFGHHEDDSAQTLLMNLLHKGEFAGMLPKVPMHEYGITIIRPLILATEQDIITFSKHFGFARITCRCPVGQNSARKKTDHMLKELETLFPNARSNLAQASLKYGSKKASEVPKKRRELKAEKSDTV